MPTFKELTSFTVYWYFTVVFGVFGCVYYWLCRLVGRYSSSGSAVKLKQPPCLTSLEYGVHKYFKNEGIKLHYVTSGAEKQRCVLLVHENPGFWFSWRRQIPALAEHFQVIAIDLRGCGDSEIPGARSSYSKESLVRDLLFLIEISGFASVYLVCSESSGMLGWDLAQAHPEKVSKLVVVNAPHPSVAHQLFHWTFLHYIKYWYFLFLQIPALPEMVISHHHVTRWLEALVQQQLKSKNQSEEEIDAFRYNFSRLDDWKGVLSNLRQIDLRPFSRRKSEPDIVVPTLMLVSSNHPFVPVEAAYRSAELVEKIKIRVIEGGERNVQVTHASRVNSELLNFLVDKPKVPGSSKAPLKSQGDQSVVNRVLGAVTVPYVFNLFRVL